MNKRIAILLPCLNEETTIEQTIVGFRIALPDAAIYVFDNNSTDGSVVRAQAAGATVIHELQRGKGHVVRRMFAEIEADIYVLADADDAFDASVAPAMIEQLCQNNLDMIVGTRKLDKTNTRRGHSWGNQFFNWVVSLLFGKYFTDIFSGYRVLSRRLVKSFPVSSTGFEIEAELSIHALELRIPTAEMKTLYKPRPKESSSKLKTFPDGMIILKEIAILFTQVKPFLTFSVFAIILFISGLVFGYPVIDVFLKTGEVTLPSSCDISRISHGACCPQFILWAHTLQRKSRAA